MKNKKYIIIGLLVSISLFSLKMFNDYSLDSIISYNSANFESLLVNFELFTDNKGHAEDLSEFLSQYRVKKISKFEYERERDLKETKGFHVFVNPQKGKTTMVFIYGDRLHRFDSSYYKILNGPIDMDWVNDFIKELEQEQ
ncbi:hypothetical protein [Halalkalibacter akibai]|uniref:Uncharacterized protein n=1 Tax=Halalkalibacter akibai (strain ATCC 43226 / DSM 21942 / CIP 109018 / JCM 9157 / 1139) TaxID=1236973 RepID=W4R027_HALA3|nr:hypothetical protein [Halalkalibacter akibai]GAE37497.1 hypothetical protein JCM9157_4802 [Halalkalibacter akibai JCM 9157]